MPPPLIRPRWRRPAAVAIAAGAVLAVGLAIVFFHGHSTSFDESIARQLFIHLGPGWRDAFLGLSEPGISFGLLAMITLGALLARRVDVAILAVVGPSAAIVLTEWILKPIVRRVLGPHGAEFTMRFVGSYPSGHETGVTSTALVLLVLSGQLLLSRRARTAVVVVLALWVVVAAVGLVRGFYHYATDTVGAVGVSVAVVLGVALAVDRFVPARWSARRSAPAQFT